MAMVSGVAAYAQSFDGAEIVSEGNTVTLTGGPLPGEFSWALGFLDGGSGNMGGSPSITAGPFFGDLSLLNAVIPSVNTYEASVFPNPFSETVTFDFADARQAPHTLRITDAAGRTVATLPLNPSEPKPVLSTGHLVPGIYIMELTGSAGTSRHRLVKN